MHVDNFNCIVYNCLLAIIIIAPGEFAASHIAYEVTFQQSDRSFLLEITFVVGEVKLMSPLCSYMTSYLVQLHSTYN